MELAQNRMTERGPGLLLMLFAVLIAVKLADITWKVFPQPYFDSPPFSSAELAKQKMTRITGRPPPTMPENDIAKLHLFEPVQLIKPVQAVEIPDEAVRSQLNLKLRGVLSTTVTGESLAVIEYQNDANYYAVNEALPGGAILKKVFPDKVIIDNNGRLEKLEMPDEKNVQFQSVATTGRTIRQTPSSARNINTQKTRRLLKRYREKLTTNPQSLMGLVRATPVNVRGKLKGYRIRPGRNPRLFKDFQFRTGDVITGINGTELNDPFKSLEIVRDLRDAKQVCADILRDGVSQSQCYQVGD